MLEAKAKGLFRLRSKEALPPIGMRLLLSYPLRFRTLTENSAIGNGLNARQSHAHVEQLDGDQTSQYERDFAEQNATDHTVQDAMGEIGFLSCIAMAEPRDGSRGLSQELSIGRMLRSTLSLSGANPTQSAIDPYIQSTVAMVDPSMTLNRQLCLPFITRFVETVGVQFLHINPKALLDDFEAFFNISDDSANNTQSFLPVKRFNLYLSMATGALLSPGSGSLQGLASNYHAAAMKLFPRIIDSGARVDILHCMLSLILYSMHGDIGGSTWHLIGLAMKKAIAGRFHKEVETDSRMSPELLKARRNIFWSLYTLDRTISTITDRPFSIEDDDIAVLGPEGYQKTVSSGNDDLACHLVSHARFMSSIRDAASNSILYHYGNFCYWKDFAIGHDSATKFTAVCVKRLSCRAMIEILKVKGSVNTESNLVRGSGSIENDFIKASVDYVEEEYQRFDRGEFTGSFVDAYDIFGAGVIIVCLSAGKSLPARNANIVSKCTALLTLLGERFSGLRVFRRVLWALSGLVVGESVNDPIIRELPPVIPDGIRDLISAVI
ncbi:uncharacterized protein N7498_005257 [Penicillium cinerascens]|uniref:Xylanolytic transcriptional activator regulatory domain-containing protein n=1 Tax=Penicillium cinerascens TaxID=70096 RepID=A0A9W9SZZ0_9EURO|nr:uncharacterized protein N7498_005257 [Penicillium cinerascens]KAJ5204378.1 hypothetical protein N7498_005257 [Penicillium cinerascens]